MPHPRLGRAVFAGVLASLLLPGAALAQDGPSIGDVADQQFHARCQVLALAGGQVVQHAHAVAARLQRVGQVRADETGAAGDEDGGGGCRGDVSHDGSNGPVGSAVRRARRAA